MFSQRGVWDRLRYTFKKAQTPQAVWHQEVWWWNRRLRELRQQRTQQNPHRSNAEWQSHPTSHKVWINPQMKRIRSVPGNRVFPVRSSAIIHPTDQISTEKQKKKKKEQTLRLPGPQWQTTLNVYSQKGMRQFLRPPTRHVVMHPVQHDLWSAVPARGHVAGHLIVGVPRQTKVQDLREIKGQENYCRLQNLHRCSASDCRSWVRAEVHRPSAHSLHSRPGYWVWGPEERKPANVNYCHLSFRWPS